MPTPATNAFLTRCNGDLRRARSAAQSIIPTSTGAARAIGLVLPELEGKLDGVAVRVPTPNVSMIDFKVVASRRTSVDAVNAAVKKAARGRLKGVLDTTDEPLVSMDFNHNPASSTFDLTQTQVVGGKLVRVLSWYDNEWGFANRMCDTAAAVGRFRLVIMSRFVTLDDLAVAGQRVLVRADLNVPVQGGKVTDCDTNRAASPNTSGPPEPRRASHPHVPFRPSEGQG